MSVSARRSSLSLWLWVLGAAGLVLAARLHEIHFYTGDVPYNDQWKIEAGDILLPWVKGDLQPGAFFGYHFEHIPLWTRLLAWTEVVITGRWDPLVQTTVNSLVYVVCLVLLGRWFGRQLPPLPALGVMALLVVGSVLPHAWENIAWGFQSQFPLALLGLFLHVHGSFVHAPGSRGWWSAQAAGVAGLFTLGSMWLAPLAVILVTLWIRPRPSRWLLAPLGSVLLGLGMLAYIRTTAPPGHAFAQITGSPLQFLYALLDVLGWPAGWPGALSVLCLPLLWFALQLRGAKNASPFDHIVLALGVWAVGHAAAIAYGRSSDYGGYISRYGEVLMILVLANALALARLLPVLSRWRLFGGAFALLWSSIVICGWWQLAHGGHTAHFHAHASAQATLRREAVQAYLKNRDRSLLAAPTTRSVLYQVVDQVTTVLDEPDFRRLLPSSVEPANPPDLIGQLTRRGQAHAGWCAVLAWLLLFCGVAGVLRSPPSPAVLPPFVLRTTRTLPWLASGTGIVAFGLLFCWPTPFLFDLTERWQRFFLAESTAGRLKYQLVSSSADRPAEMLLGASSLAPAAVRELFAGTGIDGDAFTCTAWSERFPIRSPWLIVPYAGWPVSAGNGLRLRIEKADGNMLTEVACGGPNSPEIRFWAADVRPYQGLNARLVLYDGRETGDPWVAAAPPIIADSAAKAGQLTTAYAHERLAVLHLSLGRLALVAGTILTLCGLFRTRVAKPAT